MFCASLGLTGPILRLVSGPRSGGFQLFGPAESGETAAAMVTGSIWGCHRSSERRENGFSESWHTTAGKIELTALAHNETVLVLDETKRAGRTNKERAQAVLDISFGLAENVERERLTNLGSVRGWRFYFLSTSNYSPMILPSVGTATLMMLNGVDLLTFRTPMAALVSMKSFMALPMAKLLPTSSRSAVENSTER